MILYPYFPYLLTDFGEIRYRGNPHNTAEHFMSVWQSVQCKPYFT